MENKMLMGMHAQGQNTTDTPGLLTIPETTHNARATKETDQISDAYQKLQKYVLHILCVLY
jgi:hypothetical protein